MARTLCGTQYCLDCPVRMRFCVIEAIYRHGTAVDHALIRRRQAKCTPKHGFNALQPMLSKIALRIAGHQQISCPSNRRSSNQWQFVRNSCAAARGSTGRGFWPSRGNRSMIKVELCLCFILTHCRSMTKRTNLKLTPSE